MKVYEKLTQEDINCLQWKYLFHGTTELIETFAPQQAYSYNELTGEMEKDWEPWIFTTPHLEIAIFRSLVNRKYLDDAEDSESEFGVEEWKLTFGATQNLLDKAREKEWLVYIFEYDSFEQMNDMEYKSLVPVQSIWLIKVINRDLPKDIKIIIL